MNSNRQIRGVVHAILGGVSAAAVCTPLFAQTAPPATAATSSDDQLQEVVVTGIRASLQKSMEIKQASIGVVDAISAEDIGQFPDSNIGDAIARIPGITVNRGNLNYASAAGAPTATGMTQGANVRGFGGSFNEVLIDGRPIASGNGQTFNFSRLQRRLCERRGSPEDPRYGPLLGHHRRHHQRQVPESARQSRGARPGVRSRTMTTRMTAASGRALARC